MTLNDAMLALSRGDKTAFDTIYQATEKTVYYIALSVLKERSLAEDVMQNTYLAVLRHANLYKPDTNPRAWIARIAQNEAYTMYKSRSKEWACEETSTLSEETDSVNEYGLLIDMARKLLPEDEFAILMLVTADGYKRREIGEMFGMPTATVTWKYNTALAKLKDALSARKETP